MIRALILATALLAVPVQGADRPNVLLILLDDLGINDLASGPMPGLQEIAERGIHFTRHYAETVCEPGRAALLTGRPAASVGFHNYRSGISPEFDTLPGQFRAAGYQTFFVGKWHLGHVYEDARPERQGFNRWTGMLEARDTAEAMEEGIPEISYIDPWLEDESGERIRHRGHLTDLLTGRAADYIGEAGDRPWFMTLAFLAPHRPIMPAARFASRFPKTPQGRYLALLAQVDAAVAELRGQLPQNTILVVTSDNGATGKDFDSNAPFAGRKGTMLEGGLRTPLLVHWPGHWEGGQTLDHTVSIADVAPTLLKAAGIEPGKTMQGRQLFETTPRPLFWYQEVPAMMQASMLSADGQWRLLASSLGASRLIHQDQFDQFAASTEAPDQAREMQAALDRWIESATRVALASDRNASGHWLYSGDRFRRTPTLGSWTLALAVSNGSAKPQRIVEQPGYLHLATTAEGKLSLEFDGHRALIALPELKGPCHTLALSAFLAKARGRASHRKPDSELGVFLDGRQIYRANYRNQAYAETPPDTPLLTYPGEGRLAALGGDSVYISTRQLDADSLAPVHRELTGACQGE